MNLESRVALPCLQNIFVQKCCPLNSLLHPSLPQLRFYFLKEPTNTLYTKVVKIEYQVNTITLKQYPRQQNL